LKSSFRKIENSWSFNSYPSHKILFKLRNTKFESSNKFSPKSTISVEAAKALTGMKFGMEAKLVGWLQGKGRGGERLWDCCCRISNELFNSGCPQQPLSQDGDVYSHKPCLYSASTRFVLLNHNWFFSDFFLLQGSDSPTSCCGDGALWCLIWRHWSCIWKQNIK
jgi:hypothetical protein